MIIHLATKIRETNLKRNLNKIGRKKIYPKNLHTAKTKVKMVVK
jgi:hypothetical protein